MSMPRYRHRMMKPTIQMAARLAAWLQQRLAASHPGHADSLRRNPPLAAHGFSSFLLLPPCCVFCGRRGLENRDLCAHCELWLPWCRGRHPVPSFPYPVHSLCHYRYPIDESIAAVKYRADRVMARVLGSLLGELMRRHRDVGFEETSGGSGTLVTLPDVLLPMPLHAERQRQRGFNQALELSRWASRCCGIGVDATLASRVRDTGALTGLSRSERQLQILGAFSATREVAGRHIGIVDDVVTTGASARELARELQDTGARAVSLWTIAATPSPEASEEGN